MFIKYWEFPDDLILDLVVLVCFVFLLSLKNVADTNNHFWFPKTVQCCYTYRILWSSLNEGK